MTLGTELRQAREQQGLTLRDLSERTQIRQPVLRAIEGDDFRHLPGGVIMRGFLKLYAREVGLDPDEIARRYAAHLESTGPDRPGDDGGDAADRGPTATSTAAPAASRVTRAGAVGAVAVLAVLAVGYLVSRSPTAPDATDAGNQRQAEATPPAQASPAPKPAESPTGTSVPRAAVTAAAPPETLPAAGTTPGDVLRVDLHATGPCWVSATADGEQVASRLMEPGERLALRVTNLAVLRIGLPGNMAVTINDQPVRPFARPGAPVTLSITPANYRDLVGQ